ncbi:MAG: hypothetical protein HC835_18800 [Oscillatoriales cyanobacterium RM2_1_1]|nr:hypothetical protein [Oscillatoriales cyanobacterium SM2_3_0]NJO47487.1 hypothetical protein [Oscillatoriales cyanobacterium RM2_1_1]
MAHINTSTLRRLQSLPQISSVWEGDRRSMSLQPGMVIEEGELEASGECIIWVDGSQGMVRAMDMVPVDISAEAIVRTLLRAMEHPQSPTPAARPQKIVVKDRELQFFLRGVLQDLDITIEYVPDLPLIDEIFRGLQEVAQNRPPQLPPQYESILNQKAYDLWEDRIWEELGDHQMISMEINQFDVETLYISTLGKLGMDYGILMYRSLDSLKQFRERIVHCRNESTKNLEDAFLTQDCLFVTFEQAEESDYDEEDINLADLPLSEIEPSFGSLHPLEGIRSILYEEEATVVFVALEALHRFWRDHQDQLIDDDFPAIEHRYRIALPQTESASKKKQLVSTKVATEPEISEELYAITAEDEGEDEGELEVSSPAVIRSDLIPPNSLLSLGVLPWDTADYLQHHVLFHHAAETGTVQAGEGLPVIVIQTSKPKAKILIQELQDAGGLTGICFNPGEDPMAGQNYELGILKTKNGSLHLFGEFNADDSNHQSARKKWNQRCQQTQGCCGLVVAMGLTGASRGQPQLKDMMALLEGRSLSPDDLGLGKMKLMSFFV